MSWTTKSAILLAAALAIPARSEADIVVSTTVNSINAFQVNPAQFDFQQGVTNTTTALSASVAQASASLTSVNDSTSMTWTTSQSYNASGFAQADISFTGVFTPLVDSAYTLTTSVTSVGTANFSSYFGSLYDSTASAYVLTTIAPNSVYTGTLLAGHVYNIVNSSSISGLTGSASVQGTFALTTAAVPEPASLSLILSGAPFLASAGWTFLRQRRKSQAV